MVQRRCRKTTPTQRRDRLSWASAASGPLGRRQRPEASLSAFRKRGRWVTVPRLLGRHLPSQLCGPRLGSTQEDQAISSLGTWVVVLGENYMASCGTRQTGLVVSGTKRGRLFISFHLFSNSMKIALCGFSLGY
ncbi:hypothetical protein LY76DRAFT_63947 [Colletotrichum caudatum]|nr:hypothetical protein LY76DRAFT_63947 [Colletotrichum caudatum]